MKPTAYLPNCVTRTTPLGVGMATLMREPSPGVQQRLLHAAHDAGFRHFDVAPSYGLGSAESVLGRFLRTKPEGVTVATKVGIQARGNAGLMRFIQRPARALLRRYPGLRGRATQAAGSVVHVPSNFSLASCNRSLEGSLRALGAEAIDLYLLHDPSPSDVTVELVEWLVRQKERGLVRSVGVAASAENAAAILLGNRGVFDAVQVPSHVLSPGLRSLPSDIPALRVTHSVLAIPLLRISGKVAADAKWAEELSAHAGEDVRAPGALAQLLLAWGLHENRDGIVLLGTSSEAHLRSAPAAVGKFAPDRLEALGVFLRRSCGP